MTPSSLRFTKMHGLGNDFMVIDNRELAIDVRQLPIKELSDRHAGVGFDQLLSIEPSDHANYFCRIFNADGSEAEQCGNGLRCVARFLHENGLVEQASFTLATNAGVFPVYIENYDHIKITMGTPHIEENLVELAFPQATPPTKRLVSIVSVGNPHAIVKVEAADTVQIANIGAEIAAHMHFPRGANVGFMQIISPDHIRLRTFERGAGETHACGSNACAAAMAGIVNGWLANKVKVEFRYGSLLIESEGLQGPLHMTGPAATIFSGEIVG